MKCQRCHGMMVREAVFTSQGGIPVCRCIQCGEIVDKLVILNRYRSEFILEGVAVGGGIAYRMALS